MKYERLTNHGEPFYGFEKCRTCEYGKDGCDNWCDQITGCFCRLQELEDKIENGELCEREEVRKETAKEILLLLGKGFDETTGKDFKDLQWYKQFCRELELRYGIELFGKTEQVENSDKLGGENND